jgi:hypothetical protein
MDDNQQNSVDKEAWWYRALALGLPFFQFFDLNKSALQKVEFIWPPNLGELHLQMSAYQNGSCLLVFKIHCL